MLTKSQKPPNENHMLAESQNNPNENHMFTESQKNPNGVPSYSPGLPESARATLGLLIDRKHNPEGVA